MVLPPAPAQQLIKESSWRRQEIAETTKDSMKEYKQINMFTQQFQVMINKALMTVQQGIKCI